MINKHDMDRFLAISWLYLLMTGKDTNEMLRPEMEDLIVAINHEYAAGPDSVPAWSGLVL